jgi:beta-xylosidase
MLATTFAPRSLSKWLSLFALPISFVCATDSADGQSEATTNPSLVSNAALDFPDPFVLREGNFYYALATSARGRNIQVARSTDLSSWAQLPDALPRLPAWASKAARLTWAPSVLKRADQYVLYYTTRDARSGFQCISRGVAHEPAGPYADDSGAPLVCQVAGAESLCGSIDPSPFVDADGAPYLYWKSDENALACRTAPRVWVQRLTLDGLALEGVATPLLTMDRAWEARIVEGPSMLLQDGRYFLFYSANWYASPNYAVGYATCRTPAGPCEKITNDEPWLRSIGNALGPGGQEFFRDAAGQAYIAYHAWTAPATTYREGGARSLHVEPITVVAGIPTLVR